jgi:hypothetical protein
MSVDLGVRCVLHLVRLVRLNFIGKVDVHEGQKFVVYHSSVRPQVHNDLLLVHILLCQVFDFKSAHRTPPANECVSKGEATKSSLQAHY